MPATSASEFDIANDEDKLSDEESCYQVTDREFAHLQKEYGDLAKWQANRTLRRINCPKSRMPDNFEDITQDISYAIVRACQRYKRQKFVVGCIEYFRTRPDAIPPMHHVNLMVALFHWQMRAKLGPQHGFRTVHHHWIVEAIDAVDAPVDFEHTPVHLSIPYLRTHLENTWHPLTRGEEETCHTFINDFSTGRVDRFRDLGRTINGFSSKLSDMPVKPCRWRPFSAIVDEYFPQVVKAYIRHQGIKSGMVSEKQEKMMRSSVDIDEYAHLIPDMSASAQSLMYQDQVAMIRQQLVRGKDRELLAVFDHITQGEDNKAIYQGAISKKAVHRDLKVRLRPETVAYAIRRLSRMVADNGGLESIGELNPTDFIVPSWLQED